MFAAAHIGVMALGFVVSSADGGARKLNAPLPRAPGGDVVQELYTPDGARLVFLADAERDELFELYSVPASGGTPVKLNDQLDPKEDVQSLLWITPDSARVLFVETTDRFAVGRLLSVPVDGSAPAVELASGTFSSFKVRVSHDGRFVLLWDNGSLSARAIDASAPAFPLTSTLPNGRSVSSFEVSPTANRVVYVANANDFQVRDLFAVDIAPGALPVQLDPPLPSGGSLTSSVNSNWFQVSADGTRVVYLADQQTDDVFELFGVPMSGGTAVLLSGSVVSGFLNVVDFRIDPTSNRVVFDVTNWSSTALYSAPLDGSGAPIELHDSVVDWKIDPTGARVVFQASLYSHRRPDLWSRAIDGSSPAVELGPEAGSFEINAQGTRVAYHFTDVYTPNSFIVSTPIDAESLNWIPISFQGTEHGFTFTPDGATLVHMEDLDVPGRAELFTVPASGGVPAKLNDPLPDGGKVRNFLVHPSGGSVSFQADLAIPSVFEAFFVPLSGGANTLQSGSMLDTNLLGSVSAFRTANRRAVYIAHPGDPDHAQLFGAPFKGGARVLSLGGSQHVDPERLELTPDGKRVLYLATNTSPTGDVELFSASTDGSSPPVRLAPDMVGDELALPFRLVPDGRSVVFLSDRRTEDVRELFAGPSDGSFTAVRLSGNLAPGGDVVDFAAAPDGSGVVYLADQTTDEVFELFSRTLPGSPVRLNGPLAASGDVTSFQVSPDGTFVVYLADETVNDVFEVFRAPIDGSSAPVRLNSTLPLNGDVISFQISPDGQRVVYLTDPFFGRGKLYSAPSNGSSSPVQFQPPQNGGVEEDYQFRSGIVVFRAITGFAVGLFAAPVDGSAPARALVSPSVPDERVGAFQLTPDGTRALFFSDDFQHYRLHGVLTDGSSAPYGIDTGMTPSGRVDSLAISSDGAQVAFLADLNGQGVGELFLARTDGLSTPYRINRPLGALGDVAPDFQFTPDGTQLLFRAENQDPDAFELFVRTVDGHLSGASDPGD